MGSISTPLSTKGDTNLFQPLTLGPVKLQHRIAMAPMTRMRGTPARIPNDHMKTYYSQRSLIPGTLLISEGTFINSNAGGFPCAPGIWSSAQTDAWKSITHAVHENGSFIFAQLFAMGRAASTDVTQEEGGEIIAPSAIPIDEGSPVPRAMTVEEIRHIIMDFVIASKYAIEAGFDGVEIHGANGYLLDQFIQDTSNQRTDMYGGSIENRSRLMVEVVNAVVKEIGVERVGVRLSPWSEFQGMKMKETAAQHLDVVERLNKFEGLAYLHLVESRISGGSDAAGGGKESLDCFIKGWNGNLLIAGGYTAELARLLVDDKWPERDIVVVFARKFISNPDLVWRIKEGKELAAYDRDTFYIPGEKRGYADYPFAEGFLESRKA